MVAAAPLRLPLALARAVPGPGPGPCTHGTQAGIGTPSQAVVVAVPLALALQVARRGKAYTGTWYYGMGEFAHSTGMGAKLSHTMNVKNRRTHTVVPIPYRIILYIVD